MPACVDDDPIAIQRDEDSQGKANAIMIKEPDHRAGQRTRVWITTDRRPISIDQAFRIEFTGSGRFKMRRIAAFAVCFAVP